ncbi:MAG: 3-dehydroquinate synthase [Acidimicrobiia bacterium]
MDRVLIGDRCDVLVGRRLLEGEILAAREGRRRVAILTQPGTPAGLARRVARRLRSHGLAAEVRVVPDRDQAKTLQVAEGVYQWLAELQVGRSDTLVGLGGGAVTDLAGFVAATWLRGVEVVHVPTTLLGGVDAAIGGKTGINLHGKNLVGVFWHPARVVVDLDVLEGLPDHLRREGLAEALKAGLVGDPGLVAMFAELGPAAPLDEVVGRAVRVKAKVVEEDFRESGLRAILNYGHTIGHALETAAGIPHGEAVAVGMVAAGAVAERRAGFRGAAEQSRIVASLGLPVVSPPVDGGRVRELLVLDKKRDMRGVRMVLLREVGEPVVDWVEAGDVDAGLRAVGVP